MQKLSLKNALLLLSLPILALVVAACQPADQPSDQPFDQQPFPEQPGDPPLPEEAPEQPDTTRSTGF